ncbi:MAG: hypothetical protein ACE5R6_19145 [Candidatus Heimdallarchaeota archaeon]
MNCSTWEMLDDISPANRALKEIKKVYFALVSVKRTEANPISSMMYLLLVFWLVIMTMPVNKAQGSIIVAIICHETISFIAFTMNYPSIYNSFLPVSSPFGDPTTA